MGKRTQPFDKVAGERMRIYRTQLGMSQSDLAGKLGITFQQLQKNETGRNRISLHRAVLASEALGVSLIELSGINGAKMPRAVSKIDFRLMEAARALPGTAKPDALKLLRNMRKAAKQEK